jgi:hypothetical protein
MCLFGEVNIQQNSRDIEFYIDCDICSVTYSTIVGMPQAVDYSLNEKSETVSQSFTQREVRPESLKMDFIITII